MDTSQRDEQAIHELMERYRVSRYVAEQMYAAEQGGDLIVDGKPVLPEYDPRSLAELMHRPKPNR